MKKRTLFQNTGPAAWCWTLLMATILVIVAFCHFPELSDWHWVLPHDGKGHLPMMLGGLVFVGIVSWAVLKIRPSGKIHRGRLLAVTAVLTVVQIVLIYSYYVHTDWDVQQLTGAAQAMAEGRGVGDFKGYFRWSPNNVLLTRIFAAVFFITGPLWGMRTTLFPLLMLQCVGAGVTALLLFQTAMHIWHQKNCALLVYTFYLLLVWLSPWWSIPYSDIWGLMLSVLILWLATVAPFKRLWVRIFIVSILCAISYYIRPQILFVGFAIVLVHLLGMLRRREKAKRLLRPTGIALCGIVAGVLAAHLAVAGCGLHLHTSKGLGATHFLMMGANYQSIGIYSVQDVDYSRSFQHKTERKRAELQMTFKRYHDLGVNGTLLLWGRKNLLNFSDGTFYWGREGAFFKYIPERSGWLSKLTRGIYYNRVQPGRWNEGWSIAVTALWFGLLILSLLGALPIRRREPRQEQREQMMEIVFFALTMLTLFHTLCEARARYLLCFAPFFILAAVEGARRTFEKRSGEKKSK
ncbi:MAG: hypothetical protein K5864_09400 [Bacteroidales bacterium]|nr:hypothetical protein [Bacteroidales bacterium]